LQSLLTGTIALTVLAVVALLLTVSRWPRTIEAVAWRRLRVVYLAAIGSQAAHFAEELSNGFYLRFPEQLGLSPWSPNAFIILNGFWLVVWVVSLLGLRRYFRVAAFPAWFLALAGIVNGVAHPLLALRVGGYFPGLFTSPLVFVAGLLLLRELNRATTPRRPA
jgi:hypothetical protein